MMHRHVLVNIGVTNLGIIFEKYDLLNVESVTCWLLNEKYGYAIIDIRGVGTEMIEGPAMKSARVFVQSFARDEAKKIRSKG